VNVQVEGYDVSTRDNNVWLIDNQTDWDSSALPVPDAGKIVDHLPTGP
jgi:hypothetical protein